MARRRSGRRDGAETRPDGGATGHDAEQRVMADALHGAIDAAGYKRVVLGSSFLKYISDALQERHATVQAENGEDAAEDREDCIAEVIFRVPSQARWAHPEAQASQSIIGLTVDQAMAATERVSGKLRVQSQWA